MACRCKTTGGLPLQNNLLMLHFSLWLSCLIYHNTVLWCSAGDVTPQAVRGSSCRRPEGTSVGVVPVVFVAVAPRQPPAGACAAACQ